MMIPRIMTRRERVRDLVEHMLEHVGLRVALEDFLCGEISPGDLAASITAARDDIEQAELVDAHVYKTERGCV